METRSVFNDEFFQWQGAFLLGSGCIWLIALYVFDPAGLNAIQMVPGMPDSMDIS